VLNNQPDDQLSRLLIDRYTFDPMPGDTIDNDWVACENFLVRRLDDAAGKGNTNAH
jgi:hypothetical protein